MKIAALILALALSSCFAIAKPAYALDQLPSCRDAKPGEACALPTAKKVLKVVEEDEDVQEEPQSASLREESSPSREASSVLMLVYAGPKKKSAPMAMATPKKKIYESPNLVGYQSPLFN